MHFCVFVCLCVRSFVFLLIIPFHLLGISKWVRKRISQYNNFAMAMASLKEFAYARKKEPCPAIISPSSLSQLSRSTVETPAKEQSIHTDTKPPIYLTSQGNHAGGFTLEQSVHFATPLQRTDAKPTAEPFSVDKAQGSPSLANAQGNLSLANAQVNLTGGFTQNVHRATLVQRTDARMPSEERTVLANGHSKPVRDGTLDQNVHYATPFQRSDTKPSVKHIPPANVQGNQVGGFTLEQNVQCSTPVQGTVTKPSVVQRSAAYTQGNQIAGFTPSSSLLQSSVSDVASTSLSFNAERVASKLDKFKRKSDDQDGKERKVFNGMTLVLDVKPVNGTNLLSPKSNELKVDAKMEKQVSDCVTTVQKNPESEKLSREQLASSPLLFGTPQSSPSSSPVKQELNSFTPDQREEKTGLRSSKEDLGREEASAVKSIENGESNLDNNSICTSKKGDDFCEPSLVENASGQGFVPARKLFKVKEPGASVTDRGDHGNEVNEEKKSRDFLDDVKENFSNDKADLKHCLQTTAPKIECNVDSEENVQKGTMNVAERSDLSSNGVPEISSNVRQGRRRSNRLRRSSKSTGNTRKEEKDACDEV